MLLAQLADFYFKQHIYAEGDALRRRDGEEEKGLGDRGDGREVGINKREGAR